MRVPLVANGVRAVTERLTGMMPHDSRKNNNASPLAGATTAGTISRGHGHDALTATKRALALRVLFDPDAAGTLLDHYRARTAQIRAAAGKRAAALRRAPPYRAAAYLLAGFALYMLYRRRNRDRWSLLREHKERRAAVQTALDDAKSYEEFIALAHRMEALEEEHAARIRALERGGKHHRAQGHTGPRGHRRRPTSTTVHLPTTTTTRAACGASGCTLATASALTTRNSSRNSSGSFARSARRVTWRR